jgi:deoxyribonuclease-4
MNARERGGLFPDRDSYLCVFDKIGTALGDRYARTLHCHFSKIEYGKGGEKKHLTFEDQIYGPEFAPLAEAIARDSLAPRIISESAGTMAEDALAMKRMYEHAKNH